jgi:hypothetical protein
MFPLCLALRQANAMASKRAAHGSSLMVNIFVRSPASSGAFLAVAMTPLLLLLSKTQSEQFAAVLLAFIGAIYVGFGLQTGTRTQIITEWTVALGFFGAAWWVFGSLLGSFQPLMSCTDFGITRIIKIQGSRRYLRGIHHYVPSWIGWQRRF